MAAAALALTPDILLWIKGSGLYLTSVRIEGVELCVFLVDYRIFGVPVVHKTVLWLPRVSTAWVQRAVLSLPDHIILIFTVLDTPPDDLMNIMLRRLDEFCKDPGFRV